MAKILGRSNTEQTPPYSSKWPAGYRRNRKEEVIISRLRIGHTHITHSQLLKGEDSPVCLTCKVPLTVKHITVTGSDEFTQNITKQII